MFNIAIVNDNQIIREMIASTVSQTMFESSVEWKLFQYDSSESFLEDPVQHTFHLFLLDIEMPGMNGIELAKHISQRFNDAVIIFITSYEGHMKNAFGVNVHRYIMKSEFDRELPSEIRKIVNRFTKKDAKKFKTPNGTVHVSLENIVYIELVERNPHLMTVSGETIKLSASSLKSIYLDIGSNSFIQINNQTIIHMKYIYKLTHRTLKLLNVDKEFTISRLKYKETMNHYHHYLMDGTTL